MCFCAALYSGKVSTVFFVALPDVIVWHGAPVKRHAENSAVVKKNVYRKLYIF